jgi:hypothetical protein
VRLLRRHWSTAGGVSESRETFGKGPRTERALQRLREIGSKRASESGLGACGPQEGCKTASDFRRRGANGDADAEVAPARRDPWAL